MMQSNMVAVIAAHPDDEVLGCGGTIAKHVKKGDDVHIFIVAEGVTSRDEERNQKLRSCEISGLGKSACEARRILGATSLKMHSFPDNRMDSIDRLDVIKVVEDFIESVRPSIVYTHFASDVNIDHKRVHEAVVTACRPTPNHSVKKILFFEISSSTDWQPPALLTPFMPNWFIDISDTLGLKLRALKAYSSEMRAFPHPRSVVALEHLAKWRGATVGVNAAEAFVLGRNLENFTHLTLEKTKEKYNALR